MVRLEARTDRSVALFPCACLVCRQFHVEGLTRDRPIMDVQWSPHYSELLLAAYNTQAARGEEEEPTNTREGGPCTILCCSSSHAHSSPLLPAASGDQDPHLQQQQQWSQPHAGGGGSSDGLVLLWSLAMQNRPEFRFECQSPVLTARFHDHDSHVVLG